MVTQDTSLLHRSVRDNIVYGRPDASDDRDDRAARARRGARLHREAVRPQGPHGYDAHVGERGVKLSGGQRQRIAIARVMLKDAPILLLDEATSALDSEVEAAIQQSLYRLMEGKTVVAIAHRLSTIAAMDRLVVMDKGRIVEDEGDHRSLLARRRHLCAAVGAPERRLPRRAGLGFDEERIPFLSGDGFYTTPDYAALNTRITDESSAEAWLARLQTLPDYYRRETENMRRGLRSGFTQPRRTVERAIADLRAQLALGPDKSPLLAPFRALPAAMPEARRTALAARGREAFETAVRPAQRALLAFFEREYLPGARPDIGIASVPQGREYYAWLARRHTSTAMTPEQIHRLGLDEVRRIRARMDETIAATGFAGTFQEFLASVRRDPRFYVGAAAYGEKCSEVAKRADYLLPQYFGLLPRLPYGVRPMPEGLESSANGYLPGSPEQGVAGMIVYKPWTAEKMPTFGIAAWVLHEGVPGHHLQIALSQEMHDLPEFRRADDITAYVEGWALYAERLGEEMGIYRDRYEQFGRLSLEIWRACRLVVDTGMHARGWSRERALACLLAHSATGADGEASAEVDRYIAWPGQALAYKMGELEHRRSCANARPELALGAALRPARVPRPRCWRPRPDAAGRAGGPGRALDRDATAGAALDAVALRAPVRLPGREAGHSPGSPQCQRHAHEFGLVGIGRAREPERARELDHARVLAQRDAGHELEPPCACGVDQALKQPPRDALALPLVGDDDRKLAGLLVGQRDVARHADLLLRTVRQRPDDDQRELAIVVDLREAREHRRCQFVQAEHEPQEARLLGQPVYELALDARVLRAYGPDHRDLAARQLQRAFQPARIRVDRHVPVGQRAGRAADDADAGIDHDRALRRDDDRIQVDRPDVGQLADDFRDAQQDVLDRALRGRRRATQRLQCVARARATDQVADEVQIQWRQRDRAVADHLDHGAAEAETDGGAEHGIAHHADHQLAAVPLEVHRLDQHAVDARVRPRERDVAQHVLVAVVHAARIGAAETHAAHVGLVRDVGREDLHRDRVAGLLRHGDGFVRRMRGPGANDRDAEGREQRLRVRRIEPLVARLKRRVEQPLRRRLVGHRGRPERRRHLQQQFLVGREQRERGDGVSTAASGVRYVGMRFSAKRRRLSATEASPIQHVKTVFFCDRATSIRASAHSSALLSATGAMTASSASTSGSARHRRTASANGAAEPSLRTYTGLPLDRLGGSRVSRPSSVCCPSRASCSPRSAARSAASWPAPPAFMTIARRRPPRRTAAPSVPAALYNCWKARMRSTPARRIAASKTSSPLTSEPVWNSRLASNSAARPAFITTTGLTRAAARRALMKRRASATVSR
jgi:uncharacterized protein (DUF885 family)